MKTQKCYKIIYSFNHFTCFHLKMIRLLKQIPLDLCAAVEPHLRSESK